MRASGKSLVYRMGWDSFLSQSQLAQVDMAKAEARLLAQGYRQIHDEWFKLEEVDGTRNASEAGPEPDAE